MSTNKIGIKTDIKGRATYALEEIKEGEVLLSISGVETSTRDKYTIQIGAHQHIFPDDLAGKYVNHSCAPNTIVNTSHDFVAVKGIRSGEEITFDYETTEDELAEPFNCFCGEENCKGAIKGRQVKEGAGRAIL